MPRSSNLINTKMDAEQQQALAEAHRHLCHLHQRLTERPELGVLSEVIPLIPIEADKFVDETLRAPITARRASIALALFCIFEIVSEGSHLMPHLLERLYENMHKFVAMPYDFFPVQHCGSYDPLYNHLYGLYLRCIINHQVPSHDDYTAIFGHFTPNDPLLAVYRAWPQSSAAYQARGKDIRMPAGFMYALRDWLATFAKGLHQKHLLYQVVLKVESWCTEQAVLERFSAMLPPPNRPSFTAQQAISAPRYDDSSIIGQQEQVPQPQGGSLFGNERSVSLQITPPPRQRGSPFDPQPPSTRSIWKPLQPRRRPSYGREDSDVMNEELTDVKDEDSNDGDWNGE